MEYVSLRSYDIPELVAPIMISLIEDAANTEANVRVITVFTVFRLLTDFACLYNYEF
jgi:hypothetical protein